MLDSSGNTESDVYLRMDSLSCLTYLVISCHPACVNYRTGCADYAAEYISKLFCKSDAALNVLGDSAAYGDDVLSSDKVYELLCCLDDFDYLSLYISFSKFEFRMYDLDSGIRW